MFTPRVTTTALLLALVAACSASDLTGGRPLPDPGDPPPDSAHTPPPDSTTTPPPDSTPVSPVASVQLTSSAGGNWVWAGNRHLLIATPRDAQGRQVVDRPVAWSSNNHAIATVDVAGNVTGASEGFATITATVDGKSATLSMSVYAAPSQDLIYAGGIPSESRLFIYRPGTNMAPRSLPLPIPAADPFPSPDGRRIAFTGTDDFNNRDVYVVNRDGSNLVRLTTSTAIDDQPAWSPDGTTIAFRSTRRGWSEIWTMSADGSNPRRLTPFPGDDDVRLPEDVSERPAWSPDGRRIAYSRTVGIGMWIEVMNVDGTGRREVTRGNDFDMQPTWAPDGRIITFARRFVGRTEPLIVSVIATTGEQVFPINAASMGTMPSYSSDGRWLARETALGTTSWRGIHVMPQFGFDLSRIVTSLGDAGARGPKWMTRP